MERPSTGPVQARGADPQAGGPGDRVSAEMLSFARVTTLIVAAFAAVEAVAVVLGLFARPLAPFILATTAGGLALAWLVALRGRGWLAVWIAVASFVWAAFAGVIALPTYFVTIIAIPAAASLTAVPFLRGRRLVVMVSLLWVVAIAAGGIGLALHPPAGSDAMGIAAAVLSLVIVAGVAGYQLARVSQAFRRDADVARMSEAKYRALFEDTPVATLVFDPETLRILATNAAAARMYGATREELLAMTARDLVDPATFGRFDAMRDRFRSDDQISLPPAARHRRLDGAVIDVDGASMLFPFDGRPARLAVLLDVTERRRLAEQVADAAARLDEAQAVAHVGTWGIDAGPDGDVESGSLRWSAEALRILGLPAETGPVRPTFFYTLVHPDDLDLVRGASRSTVRRGTPYDVEHRVVRADGDVRLVHERGDVVRGEDGRVIRFVGTIEDVTERRELERRLEAAQRLETIGRLAGGVAHDFNNLLLVISGNAEIALEELGPDAPAREPVEAIASAAARSATITRELLAFARRQRIDPRPIRLDAAVDDVLPALRDLMPPGVTLAVAHDAASPVVVADRAAIERILVNLATNARDAMPDGGTLTITTGCRSFTDGTARGVLTVADSGMGMAPEVIERAFEPFYSTKREPDGSPVVRLQGGSGLGLAIVAALVQDAGGTIEVESRVGHGSTFRVLLPVAGASPPAEATPAAAGRPRRRGRILVVEDDPGVGAFVRAALASAGHDTVAVASADEAWELLAPSGTAMRDDAGARGGAGVAGDEDDAAAAGAAAGGGDGAATAATAIAGGFDLVVSDIVMPGIGGAELARRIAARRPRMPIVLMSGYADEVEALTAAASPVAFLDKPFTRAALLDAVDLALAGTPADDPSGPDAPALGGAGLPVEA